MTEESIRLGIIGAGYWGPNLIRNFVDLPGSEVVAVADLSNERLEHVRSRYPAVQTIQDYSEFFSMGLEAAVVATPPATHFEIARECLSNDLGVLVEKPLTLSSREAEELIELAANRNRTLMVGHTFEYNPAVRALKAMIQRGELGSIYYIDSIRANLGLFQRKLNVMWDLAPHDLSVLLYLLGDEPTSVGASGGSYVLEGIHDIAYIHLEFPGGVIAHVHVSWLDPNKVRKITVVGSRKMAVYDDVHPTEKVKVFDNGVDLPPYTDTYEEFKLSYRSGDVVIPRIDMAEPLRVECEDFISSVANGTEPISGGESGLRVIKILEAADRSLKNGGDYELVPPTTHLLERPVQLQIERRLPGIRRSSAR
jgi:predicted dehydrogenase